jgi:four helix bundle protein
MSKIESFKDLISKDFPGQEKYSLTDQIRRSSRSVTACIAELWAKRRYEI